MADGCVRSVSSDDRGNRLPKMQKALFPGPFLMELNGACSNPRVQVEFPRLAALHARLRALALRSPRKPSSPPVRIGAVLATVTSVLELAEHSMRACDIHAAAE